MEIEPDGFAVALPLVRLLSCPRRNAQGNRQRSRTVVHPAFRRQETGSTELHHAPACANPLQGPASTENLPPQSLKERSVRRPEIIERAKVGAGKVLSPASVL